MKIANLQKLIEALRNELQQYGEMLALLDQQQELIRVHGGENILGSIAAINAQSGAILVARQEREALQQEVSIHLGREQQSTFAELLPLFPSPYRPLVSALVQENNELLQRVRQSAHKNQTLLRQSLDYMQQFVSALAGAEPKTPVKGEPPVLLPIPPNAALYEAIA